MDNHDDNSTKESLRIAKFQADEAKLLTQEQARTKAYQEREQELQKKQLVKDNQRIKNLADEEIKEQAKDKARKELYQANEKIIADGLAARALKNQKPPQS